MNERTYQWSTTSTAGLPLEGVVRVCPNGVTEEHRICNAAWQRSVSAARLAGANPRRLMRVTLTDAVAMLEP